MKYQTVIWEWCRLRGSSIGKGTLNRNISELKDDFCLFYKFCLFGQIFSTIVNNLDVNKLNITLIRTIFKIRKLPIRATMNLPLPCIRAQSNALQEGSSHTWIK